MFINVTKDNVLVDENSFETHQGEYKVNTCYFSFSEEFDTLTKMACFTINSSDETYKIDIIDNECDIPAEVLEKEFETITLGVYGYSVDQSDNLELRYSPTPFDFYVEKGSYKEGGETPEIITPTQYELYSQRLQEGLDEIDDAIEETNNLDLDVEKVEHTTTITITKKDGTEKIVEILDGEKGEKGDKGDSADLTDYVKNTDYATANKGGVITVGSNAVSIDANTGRLRAEARTYANYQSAGENIFVSKGTLENVLTARIGDISSVIDSINGEVI